ncbi:hypothetical protein DIURU_001516 [Diutina rugosa]|uniref:Efficient mitochondria targeting-associated protein 19 n=1 Tax=Diutina rugosa TaxID=5481 RepID=A0A642UZV5_DIURU|nr:uncharacterized protein DIURU_001516 [Diutina rugosa]KAA8905088.1 hypothetical protein DIURU_001516 [Diutina rugosa]
MTLVNRRDQVYWWYFLVHIPITIFMDSNLVVPREYQWSQSLKLLDFHIATNNDILLIDRPDWLQVFGAFELLFQLPLFFYFVYMMPRPTRQHWVWMVVYGFNAAFTTLVCLFYIYWDQGRLSDVEKYKLMAIYVPYLALPLVLMLDYARRISAALAVKPKQL